MDRPKENADLEIVQVSTADSRVLELFAGYDAFIEDFLGEDRKYYTRYTPEENLETAWLALWGKEPVGVVAYRTKSPGVGEVKRLFVKPAYRSRGTGGKLLTQVESYAVQQGCATLFLDTRSTLEPAVTLYRRRGFAEIFRAGLYMQMEKQIAK